MPSVGPGVCKNKNCNKSRPKRHGGYILYCSQECRSIGHGAALEAHYAQRRKKYLKSGNPTRGPLARCRKLDSKKVLRRCDSCSGCTTVPVDTDDPCKWCGTIFPMMPRTTV